MLPITASNPFKWRHYRGDIILWRVRWYLRYPISLVHMAEMAAERFFRRALLNNCNSTPRVINVDKNAAYARA